MITDFASLLYQQTRIAEEEGARVYEAVVGIVTDIKDDQKLCRVKVKIPSLPITDNTWWSSWISIGGAKDRGWFSLPEVDDEVLIMFEHGEIHRPIILGALWNGKDRPPSDNGDGKNNLRMLRSRAGHEVVLDDTAGAEQVIVRDGGVPGVVIFGHAIARGWPTVLLVWGLVAALGLAARAVLGGLYGHALHIMRENPTAGSIAIAHDDDRTAAQVIEAIVGARRDAVPVELVWSLKTLAEQRRESCLIGLWFSPSTVVTKRGQ